MTLSLSSLLAFLTNVSVPVNVTIHFTANIYDYTWKHLFLAYDLTILFGLVSVFLGSCTVWRSRTCNRSPPR